MCIRDSSLSLSLPLSLYISLSISFTSSLIHPLFSGNKYLDISFFFSFTSWMTIILHKLDNCLISITPDIVIQISCQWFLQEDFISLFSSFSFWFVSFFGFGFYSPSCMPLGYSCQFHPTINAVSIFPFYLHSPWEWHTFICLPPTHTKLFL